MNNFQNLDKAAPLHPSLDLEGVGLLAEKPFARYELFAIVSAAVNAALDEREARRAASNGGFDVVNFINERYGNRWQAATPAAEQIEAVKEVGRMCARSGLTIPDEHLPDEPAFYKPAFKAGYDEGLRWSDEEYHAHLFERLEQTVKQMKAAQEAL